jgi:hypothetical protein
MQGIYNYVLETHYVSRSYYYYYYY